MIFENNLFYDLIYLGFPSSQWNRRSKKENRWSRKEKKTAGVGSSGLRWGARWSEKNQWAVAEC